MPIPLLRGSFSDPRLKRKNEGVFGGPAAGESVGPVYPTTPVQTPNPAMQIGGSYTPDYASLIQGDAGLQAFRNTAGLTADQAAARRSAALRSLAVQHGGLPEGTEDPYGDIDAGTLELARKNQYSATNELARNYDESVEAMKRALAARGALRSSELGYGLSQTDLARGKKEYDLGLGFSNALQGQLNDYTSTINRLRQDEASAVAQAAQSVYSNPANRPADAVMASLMPGSMEQYGVPVYQGPDGKLYNADGSAFLPPAPAPAPSGGASIPLLSGSFSAPRLSTQSGGGGGVMGANPLLRPRPPRTPRLGQALY